ncbi:hypothetical protein ACIBO6_24145 [Streptomyces luteogriseus]|uniref:hypothetical protein n=1 Tax=Streptomyces luteogriseus TaxID=68233 RepID=UPI0037B64DB3
MTSTTRSKQPTSRGEDGSRHFAGDSLRPAQPPEITPLDEQQRDRIHRLLRRRRPACPSCGNRRRWTVGDALPLGFLFLDEEEDAYMVALTCGRRGCPRPRTGIVVREEDFLSA